MFSLLDGLGQIEELCAEAKRSGMTSLALTDHGAMYGIVDFYTTAKKYGLKPILGVEAYMAPDGIDYKPEGRGRPPTNHLLLLARNNAGYKNLLKLTTIAHLEGFYYKPRIDKAILRQHAEGLIGTTSCLKGEIPEALLQGNEKKAEALLIEYRDILGRENFYAEIQFHDIPEQDQLNELLIPFAKKHDLPIIATNDVHYVRQDDWEAQDVIVCVQTGKLLADKDRMQMTSHDFYLRTPDEMAELCKHVPEAVRNTQTIADRCNVEIPFDQQLLPNFAVPAGHSQDSYLITLCVAGLVTRYGIEADGALSLKSVDTDHPSGASVEKAEQVLARLRYELSVINPMGYAAYYLIVQDLVNTARSRGIGVGPGRGSGAGSMAAYLVGITDLDPLDHGLLFERFLNPERASMPDFDLDFADDRRDEVIQYCIETYGEDKVAQIITFGSMLARAAIRDTGRVLGMAYGDVDRIAKLVPAGDTLAEALDASSELKQLYDHDPGVKKLLDLAARLEGVARHSSTHAAAVVISKHPLVEDTPLQKDQESGRITTQYSMKPADKIGLLKIDFLGLRTLTIINNAVLLIAATTARTLDMSRIPLNDKPTYDMLARGETLGVFQIESGGMIRLAKDLKPTCFEDITAMIALFRPGPMAWIGDFIAAKHGNKKPSYPHPSLEPFLKETYGIAVYQEQIQQIAQEFAGFSLGEGYTLIKAIGKKIAGLLERQRAQFIAGAEAKQGVSREKAEELFSFIEPFARYGFNKSHAACYAMLTYQTAYLKQNYPAEFMAALLTSEMSNQEKVTLYIGECKRMGIHLLGPDINRSQMTFSIENQTVRFGLQGIRNVGEAAIENIIAKRDAEPFTSLHDFCTRVDSRACNLKVLESLIKSGAFDAFGNRNQHLQSLEQTLALAGRAQAARRNGQTSFFGKRDGAGNDTGVSLTAHQLPDVSDVSLSERLQWEHELLGYYFSEHPLDMFAPSQAAAGLTDIRAVREQAAGAKIRAFGIVRQIRRVTTKKGEAMAFVQLEDQADKMELVIFPKVFKSTSTLWEEGTIVLAAGKLDHKDGDPKLLVDTAQSVSYAEAENPEAFALAHPLGEFAVEYSSPIKPQHGNISINIPAQKSDMLTLQKIQKILLKYPGGFNVSLALYADSDRRRQVQTKLKIDAMHEVMTMELEVLLGRQAVEILS